MPFQSTGAAVAGTLDDILTSRKKEQRQAMLDALNQRNVESEIGARDENSKMSAMLREAQAANQRSVAEQNTLENIDKNPPPINADIEGKYDPATMAIGDKFGRFKNTMIQNPQGETEGTFDQHKVWAGNPKQVENQHIDDTINGMMPSILSAFGDDSQKKSIIEAIFKSHLATHTIPNATEFGQFQRPTTNETYTRDRKGAIHKGDVSGPIVTSIPTGAIVGNEPAPTHDPHNRYQAFESSTQGLMNYNPETGEYTPAKVTTPLAPPPPPPFTPGPSPASADRIPTPSSPPAKPTTSLGVLQRAGAAPIRVPPPMLGNKIPERLREILISTSTAAHKDPNNDPTIQGNYNNAVMQAIAASGYSPEATQMVTSIFQDPQSHNPAFSWKQNVHPDPIEAQNPQVQKQLQEAEALWYALGGK